MAIGFPYAYGYKLWSADQARMGALELETKALKTNIDLLFAAEAIKP